MVQKFSRDESERENLFVGLVCVCIYTYSLYRRTSKGQSRRRDLESVGNPSFHVLCVGVVLPAVRLSNAGSLPVSSSFRRALPLCCVELLKNHLHSSRFATKLILTAFIAYNVPLLQWRKKKESASFSTAAVAAAAAAAAAGCVCL